MSTRDIGESLEFELQETDRSRELDSLETVVVRSFMAGRGYAVPDDLQLQPNTMEKWLEWAARASRGG